MEAIERFVYLVIIVALFSYYSFNDCINSKGMQRCELRSCNRLLKRYFKYCVLILIILIILLITGKFGDNSQLLDYISFGSTLSSIILSILAIFMTMLAESKSDATKTRLENLTSLIETASESIKDQVEKIEKVYKAMEERYPTYEKILENQDQLITRLEKLEESNKKIQEGIKIQRYTDTKNNWSRKSVEERNEKQDRN